MTDINAILSRAAEAEKVAEKATPGPWQHGGRGRFGDAIALAGTDEWGEERLIECPGSGGAMSLTVTVCETHWSGTPEWDANRDFIASARTTVPALVKDIRGLASRAQAAEARATAAEGLLAETTMYAERLAVALGGKHYPEVTQWRPLSGDLMGLLSQIDNMTCGLARIDSHLSTVKEPQP